MSEVKMLYRNWRGQIGIRRFQPIEMYFGTNPYHEVATWLIEANDLDKHDTRTFALKSFDMTNEVALRDAMLAERNAILAEMSGALSQLMGTAAEPEEANTARYFSDALDRARAVQEMYSRMQGNG